jgi:hypothetical protein
MARRRYVEFLFRCEGLESLPSHLQSPFEELFLGFIQDHQHGSTFTRRASSSMEISQLLSLLSKLQEDETRDANQLNIELNRLADDFIRSMLDHDHDSTPHLLYFLRHIFGNESQITSTLELQRYLQALIGLDNGDSKHLSDLNRIQQQLLQDWVRHNQSTASRIIHTDPLYFLTLSDRSYTEGIFDQVHRVQRNKLRQLQLVRTPIFFRGVCEYIRDLGHDYYLSNSEFAVLAHIFKRRITLVSSVHQNGTPVVQRYHPDGFEPHTSSSSPNEMIYVFHNGVNHYERMTLLFGM